MGGVLPYHYITKLLEKNAINNVNKTHIKPASLDLAITDQIYELESFFLPPTIKVLDYLKQTGIKFKEHPINIPLKKGRPYLIKLKGNFNLPQNIWALCSPKSSIGRIDLHVRVIAEGSGRFDHIPKGFNGKLWALVVSKSFDILLKENLTITQARFIRGQSQRVRSLSEIKQIIKTENAINNGKPVNIDPWDGGIVLSIGFGKNIAGWVAKKKAPVLDLTVNENTLDPLDYFEPVLKQNGKIQLKKGRFYLFSIKEGVRIPPYIAAEFLGIDINTGEYRTHYAGFVDPGWGLNSKVGRPLTLEIRPFEDITVSDGQPIAKLYFDKLLIPTNIRYDIDQKDAHYTKDKGVGFSKWFRKPS